MKNVYIDDYIFNNYHRVRVLLRPHNEDGVDVVDFSINDSGKVYITTDTGDMSVLSDEELDALIEGLKMLRQRKVG